MKNYNKYNVSTILSQGIRLCLKNWIYAPTAMHLLSVLKNSNPKPWSQREISNEKFEYPFLSDKEKNEIIRRANWLCKEVIVNDPEELIEKMPGIIGRQFQGQWAIYACSMTAVALCNIIRIYPDLKQIYLNKVAELIELTNTPTIRYYDTVMWKEDAIDTLKGNKSHMTYISILAWMIGNYRLAGGDDRYDILHKQLCDTLNRRMLASRDLNLPSFPNGIIFFPDMMFPVLALNDYGILWGNTYNNTVSMWLKNLRTRYIGYNTGLLASKIYRNQKRGRVSGAYSGLNTTCLTLLDQSFGDDQLINLKKHLIVSFGKYAAVKEFLHKSPKLSFDIDAGPIIFGMSPSGTAFAIGAATHVGDWELREKLLKMARLAGGNVVSGKYQHYRLADIMLTGEAITLAMRTMVNFKNIHFT